jgi:hypothetical protein
MPRAEGTRPGECRPQPARGGVVHRDPAGSCRRAEFDELAESKGRGVGSEIQTAYVGDVTRRGSRDSLRSTRDNDDRLLDFDFEVIFRLDLGPCELAIAGDQDGSSGSSIDGETMS